MDGRGRRLLQVRLTDRAREGWRRYASDQGVTLTTLLEAMGTMLADGTARLPSTAIRRAGQLDRERDSRERE